MAFPEQGQASSVAFAFRVRFTAMALSVRAGRIVTVDRLGDRRAAVPNQVLMSSSQTSCALRMDTNECRSSRGVHAPPSLAALVTLRSRRN